MANRTGNHAMKRGVKEEKKLFIYRPKDEQTRIYIIAGAIVVILIALIILGRTDCLPHFNGTLHGTYDKEARVWHLRGIEDGDIIAKQRSAYTSQNKYWKLGTYTIPEGYEDVTEKYTAVSSSPTETYRKDWYFTKDNDVNMKWVYVTGVSTESDEMIKTIKPSFTVTETETDDEGNVISETVVYEPVLEKGTYNGMDYKGFVSAVTENVNAETGEVTYQKLVAYYVEARRDKCVLVYVDSQSADKDSFADDDTYRAFAFEAMDGLKLD